MVPPVAVAVRVWVVDPSEHTVWSLAVGAKGLTQDKLALFEVTLAQTLFKCLISTLYW